MSTIPNSSPHFFKDVDILYEGANYFTQVNNKSYHEFFRIIYFEDAKATLIYEGNIFLIRESHAVVIRPHTIYEIKSESKTIKYFDLNFLDKKSIYNIDMLFKNEFIFCVADDIFFKQCFTKVTYETNQKLGSKILLQSGIGFCLLSMLFRRMKNNNAVEVNTREVTRNNIFLLSEIETKLNDNFIENSVISNLAYEVGISENKLYKVIKDTYNLAPKQWILEIKIKKIKIMLVERKTNYEIAELLAFCSVSHMSSTFKKYTGYTPIEYLKNYSNK